MNKDFKRYKPVPTSDVMVSRVWQDFVAADFNLQIESIRSREWYVLFVAESVITERDELFLEALDALEIDELLVCFGEGSASEPDKAGWLQLAERGHFVLQDAAPTSAYFFTDRRQQFCCFQVYTDMYLLAGDLEFIEAVQGCSFKTALELTLNMGEAFYESEANPGWIFEICQRYSSVFPPGVTCTPPVVSKESLMKELVPATIARPDSVETLTEIREDVRVFSPRALRNLDWSCIPIMFPFEGFVFDWAAEAERFARVAKRAGYARLEAYLFEPAQTFNAYQAPTTREGILAFSVLMLKEDIVVTGKNADFAMLGSAEGFVLVAGPKELLLRIGGHPSDFPYWIYDAALRRLEDEAPQVEGILGEVLLEYMELEEKP